MASLSEDIRTYLKTKAAITAVVGSGANAKIYCDEAKQGVDEPYIILTEYGGSSEEHLTGISGIAMNRVQIDCYSTTKSLAMTLAELVRLAPLQMYRGTAGTRTIVSVSSNGGYRSGIDPHSPGSGVRRPWVSRDYLIQHREATS